MAHVTYPPEPDAFFKTLRGRVRAYLEEHQLPRYGNRALHVKLIFLALVYLGGVGSIYLVPSAWWVLVYPLIGIVGIILGLNAGHDAAHLAVFKSRKANERLLVIFDLMGTNSYLWRGKHIQAHHPFPNVSGHDSDIQQSPVVRIFPSDEQRAYHRWQWAYMPFLYLVYILRWVLYRDFKDFSKDAVGAFTHRGDKRKEVARMLAFKALYLGYLVVLPVAWSGVNWWYGALCFLLLTVAGSAFITLVLLCAHVGEDAAFPEPDPNGLLPHSWSHHQLIVTTDFATSSWWANTFLGGFNHHTIHHLFPHVCHVHYPKLTPILQQTAREFGLRYNHRSTIPAAIASHFRLLMQRGKPLQQMAGWELD